MASIASASSYGAPPAKPEPLDPDYSDPLAKNLVATMQAIFKKHPGFRTTHAKGVLVEGKFTPTPEAKTLSTAAHFNNPSTPVIARFSVGGGIPKIADTNDQATPKGIAIRFKVNDNTHTDLIAHSFNGFATRTGEEFLEFLQVFGKFGQAKAIFEAAKEGESGYDEKKKNFGLAGAALKAFTDKVPAAGFFLKSTKPNPFNYGTITYYQPNTHVLTNKDGKVTNVRYQLIPADGDHLYTEKKDIDALAPNYLEDDLASRFPAKPIVLTIKAHIAGPDDVLDDATTLYKSDKFVTVGKLEITKKSDDNDDKQQQIAFSPVPTKGGIKGIDTSKDPLIQSRKGVYWISADERRNEKREDCDGQHK